MISNVICKSSTVSKFLVTQITLIRFFLSVTSRFFFSVSSDVTFKKPILSKALLAIGHTDIKVSLWCEF